MSKKPKGNYTIGYGKPPDHTKIKPNQILNPKGRPRGSKNFLTVFEEELKRIIPVNQNGKRKRLSHGRLGAKQFARRIAEGDLAAFKELLRYMRTLKQAEPATPASAAVPDSIYESEEQRNVIRNLVRRIRAMEPDPESLEADKDDKPEEEKDK